VLSDLVRVEVHEARTAVPAGAGVEAGMVVLREIDEPHRLLRIVMGQPEARAIHAKWSGEAAQRPGTWDLFVSVVSLLDARLERGVITAVEDGRHYFASLEIDKGGQPLVLSCRPSDAIALVLRAWGAELYAHRSVLDAAGVVDESPDAAGGVAPSGE